MTMLPSVVTFGLLALAQVDKEDSTSVWATIAMEHIAAYELSSAVDPEQKLKRVAQPVTQHVQNVRGNAVGSVYVWCDETGRPVAVCDVFFLPRGGNSYGLYDEWHSLTSESMTARWKGGVRWSPQEPGLKWAPIPRADQPATTKARQNLQLRQLSRRFTARINTRAGERYELRRLPTPIYQFETPRSDQSLCGGLFAFCQGNDPETLVVIEARTHEEGYRWEYAAAEFSNLPQFVELDGETVWEADPPRFSNSGRHTGGQRRIVDIPRPVIDQ